MEAALRTPGIADTYERILVPSIFAPWAQEILARARPIGPADRILDLGCGTGIVARLLRERLGGGARVTGADASADWAVLIGGYDERAVRAAAREFARLPGAVVSVYRPAYSLVPRDA